MSVLAPGDAVLDQQRAMTGGYVGMGRGASSAPGRHSVGNAGVVGEIGDAIDATPRFVAGIVLGAAITIFALRVAGFRFSFGANIGGGG